MLLLRCAILGQRSVFTMEVDENRLVGTFKNELQAKMKFDFTPCMMRLYVAQPIDNPRSVWLKTSHADYEALVREDARVTAAYMRVDRVMRGAWPVSDHFPCQPDEHVQNIHVLIKLPTEEELASPPSWVIDYYGPEEAETSTMGGEGVRALYKWIVAPLRDSVASLAAWIVPPNKTQDDASVGAEKQKAKAA